MKKFAMVVVAAALHAAPVGNTSAPALIETGIFTSSHNLVDFRCGYEGDFVADGRMKQGHGTHGRIDSYKQDTQTGTAVFNIQERMDIYGVFGSSELQADWRFINLSGQAFRTETDTKNSFLWAAGARAILIEWDSTSLGCGGRYSSCQYALSSLTSNGIAASTAGAELKWREWQVNLDMSYKIHFFTPYIGVKYSSARSLLDHFSVPISANGAGNNTLINRDPVGLYLGCGFSTGKYVMLNVEGRLIDEEAVTFSGDIRF